MQLWHVRRHTREEAHLFARSRKEDGRTSGQDVVRVDIRAPLLNDSQRWQWFQDAEGARSCLALGLRLQNVCLSDRDHKSTQKTFAKQDRSSGVQISGVHPRREQERSRCTPAFASWSTASQRPTPEGPRIWQQDRTAFLRQKVGLAVARPLDDACVQDAGATSSLHGRPS